MKLMKLKQADPSQGRVFESEHRVPAGLDGDLYIGPPWIDFHCHVYHGVTSFGLVPDGIGFRAGVHLLVDAGSAGEETFAGFRDYIMPRYRTKVMAFLNISSVGLVTMREYCDRRAMDPEKSAARVRENKGKIKGRIIGMKARSSGLILEGAGTLPLRLAAEAANLADCPVMVHFGEAPPANDENLALLRKGDIISHCFHGKDAPLWLSNGKPIPALAAALERGVLLDVAHGAASCDAETAGRAVAAGTRNFTISTDLHGRCVNGPVYSLAHTMSKFLSLGMSLPEVVGSVTEIPAKRLGLDGWSRDLERNATLFRLRKKRDADLPFVDSGGKGFPVETVIEPAAVVMDGEWTIL